MGGQIPNTIAIDSLIVIAKIVSGVTLPVAVIGGGIGGRLYILLTGVFSDVWIGYLSGGIVGAIGWGLLIALPLWVGIEILELFVSIELNTRIAANRSEQIHEHLKRKV
jgi:hypothetical protein